jgi:hypothetical protein
VAAKMTLCKQCGAPRDMSRDVALCGPCAKGYERERSRGKRRRTSAQTNWRRERQPKEYGDHKEARIRCYCHMAELRLPLCIPTGDYWEEKENGRAVRTLQDAG